MEEEGGLLNSNDSNNNITNPLSSYFNPQDEDLLGVGGSETGVEPDLLDIGLLDSSRESMGSNSVASIQLELATMNVSLQEVGATQMQEDEHQQQPDDQSRSMPLDIVRDAQGGAAVIYSHVGSEPNGEEYPFRKYQNCQH